LDIYLSSVANRTNQVMKCSPCWHERAAGARDFEHLWHEHQGIALIDSACERDCGRGVMPATTVVLGILRLMRWF
jgi:hypothetical protein